MVRFDGPASLAIVCLASLLACCGPPPTVAVSSPAPSPAGPAAAPPRTPEVETPSRSPSPPPATPTATPTAPPPTAPPPVAPATPTATAPATQPILPKGAPLPTPLAGPTAVSRVTATVQTPPEVFDRRTAAAFVDARHGWLTDGRAILATTDGGGQWTRQCESADQVGWVAFTSPRQ